MPFRSNCGQQLTVGTEKFCPNCGQDPKIELAKEVQDVKPGEEKQISPAKKRTLNGKFGNVIR